MKRQARRAVIGAALVAVIVVVVVVVVANWGTVRDHIEAWHFQRTQEKETIPQPQSEWVTQIIEGTPSFPRLQDGFLDHLRPTGGGRLLRATEACS